MLRDMLRDTTARVRSEGERLFDRIGSGPREARRWVQKSVWEARQRSEDSLWTLQMQAIETGRTLADQAAEVPVLERLGSAARPVIDRVADAALTPPIPDYDALNVREVMAVLRDLDGFGLRKVSHYEAAHKSRKTILDAVERETQRRDRLAARV